jgi:undecaprenyl-diphosphatase
LIDILSSPTFHMEERSGDGVRAGGSRYNARQDFRSIRGKALTTFERRPLPSSRWLLILLALGLAVGIGLGIATRGPNVLDLDLEVTGTIQRMQGRAAPGLADVGNLLGSTTWAAVTIAIALVGAALLRARVEFIFLAVLLVLRLAATQLKPLFSSPRPTDDLVTIVGDWHGTGYPSGHALTASTMALGLMVIAWRRIPSRGWAIATIALLGVLALLIGWARVWSGAHWATDVIGGYAFGVAIAAAATLVLQRIAPPESIDTDL